MNREDTFEQRLQRVTPRQAPPEWRNEILSAARAAAASRTAEINESHSAWTALRGLFWPHPVAWGGLAAAWIVIFALNFAAREPGQVQIARQAPPPSPQMRQLLQEQEQLLAELISPAEPVRAIRPKSSATQPRSERRVEFLQA
jgi:hypothetical protein